MTSLQKLHIARASPTIPQSDQGFFHSLLDLALERGEKLQELKLVRVHLGGQQAVDSLCQLLDERDYLQFLDLSWNNLSPKELNQIV